VAFKVEDTGIGIPADKHQVIFEAFQQADGTTSRKYGGTGLGLSISRQLARLLGGAITVSSKVGEGSVFTLALPEMATTDTVPAALEPEDRRLGSIVPPARRPEATAHGLRGATVLVVDDDVRNVFALTSALELHGMTVLYAENGADGVRMLDEHGRTDIVLMDAMMPALDGNETTRAIRRNPRFAELPIVFLTAKAMPGDRESSLAAGATDYVTKPVDLDDLLAVMGRWVNSGKAGSAT